MAVESKEKENLWQMLSKICKLVCCIWHVCIIPSSYSNFINSNNKVHWVKDSVNFLFPFVWQKLISRLFAFLCLFLKSKHKIVYYLSHGSLLLQNNYKKMFHSVLNLLKLAIDYSISCCCLIQSIKYIPCIYIPATYSQ